VSQLTVDKFSRWARLYPTLVWAALILGLAFRLGYVLFYPQYPIGIYDDYDEVAWNLARGWGIANVAGPIAGVGPIYPGFLALIYLIFGHNFTAVRIMQAVLSAGTIVVLYWEVREIFGERVARWSLVLMAAYPAFSFYAGMLLTETVTTFLLVLLVWSLIRAMKSPGWTPWGVAGIIMGVNVLHRQETLLIMLAYFALILLYSVREVRLQRMGIFFLMAALVIGTWTIRNFVTFEKFILVTIRGGDVLYISSLGWTEWHHDDVNFKSLVRGLNDIEKNEILRQEGIKNILNDPLRYFQFCLERTFHFWLTSHTMVVSGLSDSFGQYYSQGAIGKVVLKSLFLGVNLGLILLGIWGCYVSLHGDRAERRWALFLLAPVLVKAVIHFFLFASPRYQVPIMPFVIIFAALGLEHVFVQRDSKSVACGRE